MVSVDGDASRRYCHPVGADVVDERRVEYDGTVETLWWRPRDRDAGLVCAAAVRGSRLFEKKSWQPI